MSYIKLFPVLTLAILHSPLPESEKPQPTQCIELTNIHELYRLIGNDHVLAWIDYRADSEMRRNLDKDPQEQECMYMNLHRLTKMLGTRESHILLRVLALVPDQSKIAEFACKLSDPSLEPYINTFIDRLMTHTYDDTFIMASTIINDLLHSFEAIMTQAHNAALPIREIKVKYPNRERMIQMTPDMFRALEDARFLTTRISPSWRVCSQGTYVTPAIAEDILGLEPGFAYNLELNGMPFQFLGEGLLVLIAQTSRLSPYT